MSLILLLPCEEGIFQTVYGHPTTLLLGCLLDIIYHQRGEVVEYERLMADPKDRCQSLQ